MPRDGKVTVFGPNPMLSITVESLTGDGGDDIHLHAAGQGVWVARMAAELGADAGPLRLHRRRDGDGPAAAAGAAADRAAPGRDRRAQRRLHPRPPRRRARADRPERRDAALAGTRSTSSSRSPVAAALDADVLALCGPYPGEALPLEIYGDLVADVRPTARPVVVDLSPPRLDSALEGKPDLVKINDWELATYVDGPVDTAERCAPRRSACSRPAPAPRSSPAPRSRRWSSAAARPGS